MNREKYKKAVSKFFSEEYIEHTTFPELLKATAVCLFMANSPANIVIACETRRRLNQLKELGYTDD